LGQKEKHTLAVKWERPGFIIVGCGSGDLISRY
jgi:hypothetical protein